MASPFFLIVVCYVVSDDADFVDVLDSDEEEFKTSRPQQSDKTVIATVSVEQSSKIAITAEDEEKWYYIFMTDPGTRNSNPLGRFLSHVVTANTIADNMTLFQIAADITSFQNGVEGEPDYSVSSCYWTVLTSGEEMMDAPQGLYKFKKESPFKTVQTIKRGQACQILLVKGSAYIVYLIAANGDCCAIQVDDFGPLPFESSTMSVKQNYRGEILSFVIEDTSEDEEDEESEESEPRYVKRQGKQTSIGQKLVFSKGHRQTQFVYVGDWVCWLKPGTLLIKAVKLEDLRGGATTFKEINIKDFFNARQHEEIKDQIFIEEYSPLQAIKQSQISNLDRATFSKLENLLQVTAENRLLIFDLSGSPYPTLVNEQEAMQKTYDPQVFVDSGLQVFTTFIKQRREFGLSHKAIVRHVLCPDLFGFSVYSKEKYQGDDFETLTGIYKQYAQIDLLEVERLLDETNKGIAPSSFDFKTLFASFGKDTLYSLLLKGNLTLLKFVCAMLENSEFEPMKDTDEAEVVHPDLRRLAFSLLCKRHLSEDRSKLLSYLQMREEQTTERDMLLEIGRLSPTFTMMGSFYSQDDFKQMLGSSTPQVIEELNNFFIETKSTRLITSLEWPRGLTLLTKRSASCKVTKEEFQQLLEGKRNRNTRVVTVQLLNLGWFYRDKKNFATCSKLLQNLPDEVYSTLFIACLLDLFWQDHKQQIFWRLFVPYVVFITFTIYFMNNMLDEKVDNDEGDLSNEVKVGAAVTLAFVAYQLYQEGNQMLGQEDKKQYFKSLWNIVDLIGLSLTITVVVLTFVSNDIDVLSVMTSITSFFLLIKLFDWLKLFEQTAYYILLIQETLKDISAFLILQVIMLLIFGVPMIMLNWTRSAEEKIVEDDLGFWGLNLLLNQYLIVLGEFQLDNLADKPQAGLSYFIFFLATFFSQILMLNMLIAIMGDTFERVIEKRDISATKTKLELLADVSNNFSSSKETQDVFIFIVRPELVKSESNAWEGSLNQITRITQMQSELLRKEMVKKSDKLQKTLDDYAKTDKAGEKHLKQLVDSSMKSQMTSFATLHAEFEKLKDSNQALKDSITQVYKILDERLSKQAEKFTSNK